MGAQGTYCYCDHSFGSYGRLPPGKCTLPCPANRNKQCGGLLANAIYDTSKCLNAEVQLSHIFEVQVKSSPTTKYGKQVKSSL